MKSIFKAISNLKRLFKVKKFISIYKIIKTVKDSFYLKLKLINFFINENKIGLK